MGVSEEANSKEPEQSETEICLVMWHNGWPRFSIAK